MRPTSPVPTPDEGFTFVETMVALVICVVLLSVVSPALIASLRAEQTAAWLQDGTLTCNRIAAAGFAGLPFTNIIADAGPGWEIAETEIPDGEVQWRVWSVSPVDRPSLMVKTTVRQR